jgi:hypothetical protein
VAGWRLQAPFCVHPKTGKVCVPIDPAAAWQFSPDSGVPQLHGLLDQLAQARAEGGDKVRRRPARAGGGGEGGGQQPAHSLRNGTAGWRRQGELRNGQ